MCNPSYGCCGTPVVACMCVYTVRKKFYINYKKYRNKNEKQEAEFAYLLVILLTNDSNARIIGLLSSIFTFSSFFACVLENNIP